MRNSDYSAQLNPLLARAEHSIEVLDTQLKSDIEREAEEKRKADELAAALKLKQEEDAAALLRAQKAEVERVKELQKQLTDLVGVGGVLHDPVSQ
jgi:hypothetical protein